MDRSAWNTLMSLLRFSCIMAVLAFAVHGGTEAKADSGPCSGSYGEPPHPPGGSPQPYIGGQVVQIVNGVPTAVSGATLRLHLCSGSSDTTVATQTSDSSGGFTFSALSGPSWYYVLADLTGPLAGLTPLSSPALVGIGSGTNVLYLAHH